MHCIRIYTKIIIYNSNVINSLKRSKNQIYSKKLDVNLKKKKKFEQKFELTVIKIEIN